MWVQPCGLMLDACVLEGPPVSVGVNRPQLQHRVRPRHFPSHPGAFHAIRFRSTSDVMWKLSGYTIHFEPAGRR